MNLTLALVSLLALPLVSSAAVDHGRPADRTPYDPYMQPVRRVLQKTGAKASSPAAVAELMKTAFGFRYSHRTAYTAQNPEVTEQRAAGDCKDKALWLCHKMGDRSVRFVIGKSHSESKVNHAWLTWKSQGTTWILDPTNSAAPVPADAITDGDYQPLYSYSRGGKFEHGSKSTRPVAQNDRRRR